jgi:hypothetical protein
VKRIILKRLLLLSAMAAMVLVPAVAGMADTSTFQSVDEGGVTQDSSSESESAELGQTFEVAGSGGNSDQCAGVQGAGNTTSLEGGTHILQSNSDANDFSFEDVGGSQVNIIQADAGADNFGFDGVGGPLTVEGNNETSCGQGVNQGGSASD